MQSRGRTWSLATLDRDQAYTLWFSVDELRWEVRPAGELEGTVVTRATRARQRSESPEPPARSAARTGRTDAPNAAPPGSLGGLPGPEVT